MSLMAFSNSLILSSNLRAAFQNALLIFFGFKTIFLNVYLEVVNFIDFLFHVSRNLSADVMFFFSIVVTNCPIVILRISSFASIALDSRSVVLVMMLGLSWRGCHFCRK